MHGDRLWGHERCSWIYGGRSGDPSTLAAVRDLRPRASRSCRRWTNRRRRGCRGASASTPSAPWRRPRCRASASGGRGALRPGTRDRGVARPAETGRRGLSPRAHPSPFLCRDAAPADGCRGRAPSATRPGLRHAREARRLDQFHIPACAKARRGITARAVHRRRILFTRTRSDLGRGQQNTTIRLHPETGSVRVRAAVGTDIRTVVRKCPAQPCALCVQCPRGTTRERE